VGRAGTLAQRYRHFGEVDAAGTSPLYERVAVALSESDEALRAIEAAPARKRHPTVILAALHDLALAGRAPTLAAAYAADDGTRLLPRRSTPLTGHDRPGRGPSREPAGACRTRPDAVPCSIRRSPRQRDVPAPTRLG
jgi:hypothetical protein